ncbi:hypothetical protein H70357_21405 [Paenibacillus sp. FSL H7-0357]|uniref:hypothetical protein n=1 Tax=Paenibacillus sp. FSL H7-0357 TaxID=1536774 RepID=UPI0004F84446|nr:hypothetical protein [Paenibacillus sp. FSL H7-0357]AIQ18973.1 hypothetical protein H70357_21405 [Paenibacillus sp. FSL H7-0357]
MSRKIVVNIIVGAIGFLFTFFVNYGHNLLGTSLIRASFGFIIWFVLAFLLSWVLGFIAGQSVEPEDAETNLEGNEALGGNFDVITPDEDEELINLLKPKPAEESGSSEGFTPLQPPKLVSMKDPEELAKAVRHLKEE